MEKYILTVNILQSDKKRNFSTQNLEFTFEGPKPIEARAKAISKAKKLKKSFEEGSYDGITFHSPYEVQLRNYKNFNAYSIEIYFINDRGWDYQIYGFEDIMIDALEEEANSYAEHEGTAFTEIENLDGEMVEVIASNLDFFLK